MKPLFADHAVLGKGLKMMENLSLVEALTYFSSYFDFYKFEENIYLIIMRNVDFLVFPQCSTNMESVVLFLL